MLNPTAITTRLPPVLAGRNTKSLKPTNLERLWGFQSAVLMFMISLLIVVVMVYGDQRTRRGYVGVSALTNIPSYVFSCSFSSLLSLIFQSQKKL